MADGIHSLSDLIADFVVLVANHHSRKAADKDHPYGHQRFETAASLVLGGLLLAVGIGMLWSAFKKLGIPRLTYQLYILALWIAGGALTVKELLFRYMLAIAKRVKSSMLVANAWHAPLHSGFVPRCWPRNHRQPGRLSDSGSDRCTNRRIHGWQNGLGVWLGCPARPDGSFG